ncbi:MAG TPA: hypothetical protein DEO32_05525 [Ruminococcaceae bacterium]|nr:hypothetical protein [Oscillospiraceae bacterium]
MISKIKKPISIMLVLLMVFSVFAAVPITAGAVDYGENIDIYASELKAGDSFGGNINLEISADSVFVLKGGRFGRGLGSLFNVCDEDFRIDLGIYGNYQNGTFIVEKGGGFEFSPCDKNGNCTDRWYVLEVDGSTVTLGGYPNPEKYTVTWENWDGTNLKTETVEEGTIPAYDGTPEKERDDEYTYTFSGWTPEVLPVRGNVTYTAQFVPAIHHNPVPLYDKEGNIVYYYCEHCGNAYYDAEGTNLTATFTFVENSEGNYTLKLYTGDDIECVVVPDTYNGKPVTAVGNTSSNLLSDSPFYHRPEHVKTIIFGDNIKTLHRRAVYGTWELNKVYIGKGLEKAENGALSGAYPNPFEVYFDTPNANLNTYFINNVYLNLVAYAPHEGATAESLKNLADGYTKSHKFIGTDAHSYSDSSDVKWKWNSGYTSAEASIKCDGCDYTETLTDNEIEITNNEGKCVYTAAVEHEGHTYTTTYTANTTHFSGHSLTLRGDIGVNFYLNLTDDELADGVRVNFSRNGKNDSVLLDSTAEKDEKTGFYIATCYVCAAEMNDEITAAITIGKTSLDETDTYKVKDYADEIIENKNNKFSEELVTLAKTMLNYGAKAQAQFNYNTENPANAGVDYPLVALDETEINDINIAIPSKADINSALGNTGIEYYGYSLILETKTTLRFYFKKNGADVSGLRFVDYFDDVVGTVYDYSDDFCYVEINDIAAYQLAYDYELKCADTSLGSFSALSYVKDVLQNVKDNQVLTDTVTSLYRYNKAAIAYFNSTFRG